MSLNDPSPLDTSTAEASREFLRKAFPGEGDAWEDWIERRVAESVRRINQAVPQRRQPVPAATSRRRRGLLLFLAVAAVIVIAVIALRESIAAAVVQETGVIVLAVTAVLAAAVTFWMRRRERRAKVLSCRIRINTRFSSDAGESLKLTGPGDAVEDPGMVVVRIKNLGGAVIEPEDYITPLTLRFPGRRVRSVDVTASDPPTLQDAVAKHPDFESEAGTDFITLPKLRLEPDNSVYLMVVLSGTKVGERYAVPVEGELHKGRITPDATIPWIRRRTITGVGVTTLATGMLAVVLLLNNVRPLVPLPEGLVCVPGTLTVEGSSAFGLAATTAAGEYQAYCPNSFVDVRSPGSIEGVNRLADAPESERLRRLALSDGLVPESGLVPKPLAVVPFTFVANEHVPVDGITRDQARAIFTGAVTQWSEISGNPADTAPIRVVGRTSSSGTRRTVERYVLGAGGTSIDQADPTSETCVSRRQGDEGARAIVCERGATPDLLGRVADVDFAIGYADVPDVKQTRGVKQIRLDGSEATLDGIRAGYPFWTVEYLYSSGEPAEGSLARAFADYLAGPEGARTTERFEYFACGPDDLATLCDRER